MTEKYTWYVKRAFLRHELWKIVYADFAGSGLKRHRINDKVVRFWTRARAQEYADSLNAMEQQK